MGLKGFRDILLKKAEGDSRLEILVESIGQDRLANKVIESLKKMARLTAAAGRNPNSALSAYAGKMDDSDVAQLRDALGHHVSHYRGALKAMHGATDPTEKGKLRSVADQHLNKIVPLSHLAARAERHSNGRIAADLPPIRAWQANYTGTHKFPNSSLDANGKSTVTDPVTGETVGPGPPGEELIGTEGWGGRASKSKKAGHDQNKSRATPDYRYLEMPAHPEHDSLSETTHRGGFPFEDIRVGSPNEVDAGMGHLHLPDTGEVKQYVPHEFDQHPINDIFDVPEGKLSPEKKAKFAEDLANWKGSKHHAAWLDRHEALEDADKESYGARGKVKPSHHFEGIPLLEQPEHAKGKPTGGGAAQGEAVSTPASASTQTPTVSREVDIHKPPAGLDNKALLDGWDTLPDDMKRALHKEAARKK